MSNQEKLSAFAELQQMFGALPKTPLPDAEAPACYRDWFHAAMAPTQPALKAQIKEMAFMVDCSRNAVPTVETLKKLIRYLAVLGYRILMLYMEDTYEVNDEPYFGYFRGRYAKSELKAIDDYAYRFGIEVIPCVQTLAHFNQIVRWYEYQGAIDIADILCVGSPRAIALLDHMFATLRECFRTHRINVGMDEAHLLGRGRYMDTHGVVDRFEIMRQQLDIVHDLCERYAFHPMMWSDMFFSLAHVNYFDAQSDLPETVASLVKNRFDVVYWDYYHVNENHYPPMFAIHQKLKTPVYFAGGAWKWSGFTPDNRFSEATLKAGLTSAIKSHIPLAIVTAWGDNGGETSLFAILPSLVFGALLNFGESDDRALLDRYLVALSGLDHDAFLAVDLANRGFKEDHPELTNTTNKTLLFNDPLLGIMDSLATYVDPALYRQFRTIITQDAYTHSSLAYLFKTQADLLDVLSVKARLGIELRAAYRSKQSEALEASLSAINETIGKLDQFRKSFRTQWEIENKPNGFDVQDLRLGGLRARLEAAADKVQAFLNGKIEKIEELEEEPLDVMGRVHEMTFDPMNCENRLHRIATVNVND